MDAEYAAAYPEYYRRHWWWRVRESILLGKIRSLVGCTQSARILDVGCGAGLFFDALQQFGPVEGIESDAGAVESSGRWRHRIAHGQLDRSFRPAQAYDLILMLDVLEHIRNPDELLHAATRLLAANGRILVTVPAFKWLWTTHDDVNHHLRRYTANEIRRALTDAGLVVTETRYMFQSLAILKLAVRAGEAVALRSARGHRIPHPRLNAIMQAWYRAEYAAVGWLPFGSSVIAVGRLP